MHRISAGTDFGKAGGQAYEEVRAWAICTCGWNDERAYDVTGTTANEREEYRRTAVEIVHLLAKEHIAINVDPFDGLVDDDNASDDPRDWR